MASIGFRWLDILEKEFDKAFVDLDLAIGELEGDEPDVVYNVRQKLCTLSSCFAQLTHKAQTIFQNSAKIEAELIHMRAELVESKSKQEILEQELHNLLLQLHSSQLSQLPKLSLSKSLDPTKHDISNIKKKLDEELKNSPTHLSKLNKSGDEELKMNPYYSELTQLRSENTQLQLENTALRNSILALNSEVYGAKLAAKYLDKELAGRIQQLQLLGREMRGDIRDKLWRQLESEILLQRHKTVVRACRRNSVLSTSESSLAKPTIPSINEEDTQQFGDVRTVVVKRNASQGLGISITGGREHGVPILISELEPNGPAALSGQLFIGDAILSVNDRDLRQACHREAVEILRQQTGDCRLEVQYIAADDSDNSLEEDGLNFRFFDNEVCDPNDSVSLHPLHSTGLMNTPTAPRTPESNTCSRTESRNASFLPSPFPNRPATPISSEIKTKEDEQKQANNNNENILISFDELKDTKAFTAQLNTSHTVTNDNNVVENLSNHEVNSNNNSPNDYVENQHTQISESPVEIFTNGVENLQYQLNKSSILYNNEENVKEIQKFDSLDNRDDLNCSTNSLASENLSSPMQTSADIFLDSEILSTDIASNDSQSPKNMQNTEKNKQNNRINGYENNLIEVKRFNEFCLETRRSKIQNFDEDFSNPRSDQSLLNSDAESCESSPVYKTNRDYKKKNKNKKYFGMKTLQNIFNRYNGYSDISSTASEIGDDLAVIKENEKYHEDNFSAKNQSSLPKEVHKSETIISSISKQSSISDDIAAQFEENIHTFLSETFSKNNFFLEQPNGINKYTKQHNQNLRIGTALHLCSNDEQTDVVISEHTKDNRDKLFTRYVCSTNSSIVEGIGDPNFGTPV